MPRFIVTEIESLKPIALTLADLAKEHGVLSFNGTLGAGKTTLIQHVCAALGVTDDVSSPTFGLVNTYSSPIGDIFHFDLYRIKSIDELLNIGFLEYLDSGNICLIEWPEIAKGLLPDNSLAIALESQSESTRLISW